VASNAPCPTASRIVGKYTASMSSRWRMNLSGSGENPIASPGSGQSQKVIVPNGRDYASAAGVRGGRCILSECGNGRDLATFEPLYSIQLRDVVRNHSSIAAHSRHREQEFHPWYSGRSSGANPSRISRLKRV
jgi:hypothetical protein